MIDRLERRWLDFVVGSRAAETGRRLWDKLEGIDVGTYYTDHLRAYSCFLPAAIHMQSGEV